jgi:excisionase family DNA binding protein
MTTLANEKLLTPDQVAARLQISKATVYRMIAAGTLPAFPAERTRLDAQGQRPALVDGSRAVSMSCLTSFCDSKVDRRGRNCPCLAQESDAAAQSPIPGPSRTRV